VKRPENKGLAVALRRGWVVIVVAAAVAALAAVVDEARPGQTVTQAIAIVPSGAGSKGPGDATQATQLAQTYVEAIPEDGGVIRFIAKRVGRSTDEVADNITVVGNPSTSVLRLQYKDTDHDRALAADEALLTAVAGSKSFARSVAPRSMHVVHAPTVLRESSADSSAAIPIGVVVGLFLGLVLVVAWERSDPRIDGPDDLAEVAGTPATALGDVAPGNIDALLDRWRRLSANGTGSQVIGLVAGTAGTEDLVRPAASELASVSAARGQLLRLGSSASSAGNGDGSLVIVTGGVPGGPSAGEAVAADASVVVVAVARGARASELRATLAVLDQFGAPPAWALLTPRQGS
jgi:capsular polysaccharide biosynthesis protein